MSKIEVRKHHAKNKMCSKL